MIFSALSLIMMLFIGALFDDISKYIISVIFVIVTLLVLRHYFAYSTRNFFVISLIGFMPYLLWFILEAHTGPQVRYNAIDLLKIALPFGAVVFGLDMAFSTIRNRPWNRP